MNDESTTQTLAAAKYIELVHTIGKELEYATGWRGVVAQRVGISLSLLSQILKGRKVTRTTIEKAIEALKLPADHFGDVESLASVPRTIPPPPLLPQDTTQKVVQAAVGQNVMDPLLVLEAFEKLPQPTQRRLLGLMSAHH